MLKNVCDIEARLLTIACKDQSHISKKRKEILPQTFFPAETFSEPSSEKAEPVPITALFEHHQQLV